MPLNPLRRSELWLLVAKYLSIDDLKACTLVNKEWHRDFQPGVWKNLNTEFPEFRDPSYANQVAWLNAIRRNAHSIKYLRHLPYDHTIDAELSEILTTKCHALTTLEVAARDEAEWAKTLVPLVQSKPGLERIYLRVGGVNFYTPVGEHNKLLVKALEGHTRLRDLTMTCSMSDVDVLMILRACPSLKTATFDELSLGNTNGTSVTTTEVFGLLHLKISRLCNLRALATLLDRCLSFQSLRLLGSIEQAGVETSTGSPLPPLQGRRHFQHLTTLVLGGEWHSPSLSRRFNSILKTVPPHQLRQVGLTSLTVEEIRWLVEHHHDSLEIFGAFALNVPASDIASLFFACRRLTCVKIEMVGSLDARYLIAKPWVCTQLLELDVPIGLQRQRPNQGDILFSFASAEKEEEKGPSGRGLEEWQQAERVFMKRLGQCSRLEFVRTRGRVAYTPTSQGVNVDLSWKLSTGLTYLAGLVNLMRLDLGDRPYAQGISELQFMKEHWVRLKALKCSSLESEETREWLHKNWPTLIVQEAIPPKSTHDRILHQIVQPVAWWQQ